MKLIVLVPDLQVPYQDHGYVEALSAFIDTVKPDEVCQLGDIIDLPQLSRWTRGTAGEFTKRIDKDRDETVEVLRMLQVTSMVRSNHTDRLLTSISTRLPGLLGLPELTLENFLRLPELGITYYDRPIPIAPGWLVFHGDESSVSQQAGSTALGLLKKTGMSIVCGHTHRAGHVMQTYSYGGKVAKTLHAIEGGNGMRFSAAKYTKGIANWQQAFVLLHVDGKDVHPELITVVNKSFIALGERYSWR